MYYKKSSNFVDVFWLYLSLCYVENEKFLGYVLSIFSFVAYEFLSGLGKDPLTLYAPTPKKFSSFLLVLLVFFVFLLL